MAITTAQAVKDELTVLSCFISSIRERIRAAELLGKHIGMWSSRTSADDDSGQLGTLLEGLQDE